MGRHRMCPHCGNKIKEPQDPPEELVKFNEVLSKFNESQLDEYIDYNLFGDIVTKRSIIKEKFIYYRDFTKKNILDARNISIKRITYATKALKCFLEGKTRPLTENEKRNYR